MTGTSHATSRSRAAGRTAPRARHAAGRSVADRRSNLLTLRHARAADLLPAPAVLAVRGVHEDHRRPVLHLRAVVRATTSRCCRTSADLHLRRRRLRPVDAQHPPLRRWSAPAARRSSPRWAGTGSPSTASAATARSSALVLGAIMVPTTALAIPTYLLFSKVGPGQHAVGDHPAVAGQPVRAVPDAGLRRRTRSRTASSRPPASTAPASSASSSRSALRCWRPASSRCCCSRWSRPGTTTSCR